MDSIPRKFCTKCGEEKLATTEYFYKMGNRLRPDCIVCNKISQSITRNNPAHKQKAKETSKQWRDADPVRARESERNSRLKNPDKYKQIGRKWRILNPEKAREVSRQSQKRHRETSRLGYHRYQARKRALPDTLTKQEWECAVNYFKGCCAVCGRPPGFWHKLTPDHWQPLNRGGGTTANNIVPLCWGIKGCNNGKRDSDPIEWLIKKYGSRKAKTIAARIESYLKVA